MKPIPSHEESLDSKNANESNLVDEVSINSKDEKSGESDIPIQTLALNNNEDDNANTAGSIKIQQISIGSVGVAGTSSTTDFSTHFQIHRHSSFPTHKESRVVGAVKEADVEFMENTKKTSFAKGEPNSNVPDTVGEICDKSTPEQARSPRVKVGKESSPCKPSKEPLQIQLGQSAISPSTSSAIPVLKKASLVHPFLNRRKLLFNNVTASRIPRLDRSGGTGITSIKLPTSPMDSNYEPISDFCVHENELGLLKQSSYDIMMDNERKPLQKILETCDQRSPIPINLIFNELKNIKKIGEGVYGEVYSADFRCLQEFTWVYKIVAIEGDAQVNGEKQKKFMEILPEIIVSQELNKLRHGLKNCRTSGFVHMQNARIAVGKYPSSLVSCWEKYDEEYESDNDKPDFPMNQLYMVLEFEFAGRDIEAINFRDARQSLSVVLQVAHTLAVGEKALEFEHRDLHWGNIMVDCWTNKYVEFVLEGEAVFVPSCGVKVVIIDFTMARLRNTTTSSGVICLDLKDDEEQFLGTGDHQFDIYRMMRDYNRNDWQKFSPKTNIFWLHYLAHKFSSKGHYINDEGSTTVRDNVAHIKAVRELVKLTHSIFEYKSASHFVESDECEEFKQFLDFC